MPMLLLVLTVLAGLQQPAAPAARQPAIPPDLQRIDSIQPHDVLTVVVTHEPELSGDYAVDANGRIEVPLIGFVDAAGCTLDGFANRLTSALIDGYMIHPEVTVLVSHSASITVFVLGAVRLPGIVTLPTPVTLADALMNAESPAVSAGEEVVVVRPRSAGAVRPTRLNDPDAQIIPASLDRRSDQGPGFELRDGDTVYVLDRAATPSDTVRTH
jgi:protein involved in polysaccharide export with SLBB domain